MKWLDRLAVAVFVLAMAAMLSVVFDYSQNRKALNQARAEFDLNEDQGTGKLRETDIMGGKSSLENDAAGKSQTEKKFSEMLELNPDYVGWIEIPGTEIDYPVVKGRDNVFYLHNGFDGERNVCGSIFMDCRNDGDGTDRHTIIYGHNMKNGTMFKDLMEYKSLKFLEDNRTVILTFRDETRFWEIFSVYVTDTGFNFIRTDFTQDTFEGFKGVVAGKSMHAVNVDIDEAQAILTLSTCSYEFPDARFVVHASPIEYGKSLCAR